MGNFIPVTELQLGHYVIGHELVTALRTSKSGLTTYITVQPTKGETRVRRQSSATRIFVHTADEPHMDQIPLHLERANRPGTGLCGARVMNPESFERYVAPVLEQATCPRCLEEMAKFTADVPDQHLC
jgi:hypothetical protein